jgi:hypothetical protein
MYLYYFFVLKMQKKFFNLFLIFFNLQINILMLIFCTYNPSWATALRTDVRCERMGKGFMLAAAQTASSNRLGGSKQNAMHRLSAQSIDKNRQYPILSYKTHT